MATFRHIGFFAKDLHFKLLQVLTGIHFITTSNTLVNGFGETLHEPISDLQPFKLRIRSQAGPAGGINLSIGFDGSTAVAQNYQILLAGTGLNLYGFVGLNADNKILFWFTLFNLNQVIGPYTFVLQNVYEKFYASDLGLVIINSNFRSNEIWGDPAGVQYPTTAGNMTLLNNVSSISGVGNVDGVGQHAAFVGVISRDAALSNAGARGLTQDDTFFLFGQNTELVNLSQIQVDGQPCLIVPIAAGKQAAVYFP